MAVSPESHGAHLAPQHSESFAKPWLFQRGQSGNPGGKSRFHAELTRLARARTNNGADLVDLFVTVMRGDAIRVGRTRRRPNLHERMTAAMWLADRGWGRAKEMVEIIDEHTPDERRALVRVMTPDERQILRGLLEAAEARLANGVDGGIPPVVETAEHEEADDGPHVFAPPVVPLPPAH
jgi:hypothetical protein